MISIGQPLPAPRRALAALLLIPALTLNACGDDDGGDAGPSGEAAAPEDAAAATEGAGGDDATSADDDAAAVDGDSAGDSGDRDGDSAAEAAGSFCDPLAEFLDAWSAGELTPADLTAEYEALGTIAPDELVAPFEVLAEGNASVLQTGELPDQAAYDAAGQAVATYATEQCGINRPG